MTKPHKHAELIKAWADGAEIERLTGLGWFRHDWCDIWHHDSEYRIKPAPKPDVVTSLYVSATITRQFTNGDFDNLKLTFDGKTGNLKEAVVL